MTSVATATCPVWLPISILSWNSHSYALDCCNMVLLRRNWLGDSVMCQGTGEKCVQPAALMIMEVLSLCGSDAAKIELIKRK